MYTIFRPTSLFDFIPTLCYNTTTLETIFHNSGGKQMKKVFLLLTPLAAFALNSCASMGSMSALGTFIAYKNVSVPPETIFNAPVQSECSVNAADGTIYYVKIRDTPQEGIQIRIYGVRRAGTPDRDMIMLMDKRIPGGRQSLYIYEGYLWGSYGWARTLQWDDAQQKAFNTTLAQFRSVQSHFTQQSCLHHMSPLYNDLNRYGPFFHQPQSPYNQPRFPGYGDSPPRPRW